MAVNFPAAPEEFLAQMNNVPLLAVVFERKDETEPTIKHYIRPMFIYEALVWLKENSPLNCDTLLPDAGAFKKTVAHRANNVKLEETRAVPHTFTDHGLNIENFVDGENVPQIKMPLCTGRPVNAYSVIHGEEKAFPWLFCYGKNGFGEGRCKTKEFESMYFKARFMHESDRWNRDQNYLFHDANVYECCMLLNSCFNTYVNDENIPCYIWKSF